MRLILFTAASLLTIITSPLLSAALAMDIPLGAPVDDYESYETRAYCEQALRCVNQLNQIAADRGLTVEIKVEQRVIAKNLTAGVATGRFSNGKVCECVKANELECRH